MKVNKFVFFIFIQLSSMIIYSQNGHKNRLLEDDEKNMSIDSLDAPSSEDEKEISIDMEIDSNDQQELDQSIYVKLYGKHFEEEFDEMLNLNVGRRVFYNLDNFQQIIIEKILESQTDPQQIVLVVCGKLLIFRVFYEQLLFFIKKTKILKYQNLLKTQFQCDLENIPTLLPIYFNSFFHTSYVQLKRFFNSQKIHKIKKQFKVNFENADKISNQDNQDLYQIQDINQEIKLVENKTENQINKDTQFNDQIIHQEYVNFEIDNLENNENMVINENLEIIDNQHNNNINENQKIKDNIKNIDNSEIHEKNNNNKVNQMIEFNKIFDLAQFFIKILSNKEKKNKDIEKCNSVKNLENCFNLYSIDITNSNYQQSFYNEYYFKRKLDYYIKIINTHLGYYFENSLAQELQMYHLDILPQQIVTQSKEEPSTQESNDSKKFLNIEISSYKGFGFHMGINEQYDTQQYSIYLPGNQFENQLQRDHETLIWSALQDFQIDKDDFFSYINNLKNNINERLDFTLISLKKLIKKYKKRNILKTKRISYRVKQYLDRTKEILCSLMEIQNIFSLELLYSVIPLKLQNQIQLITSIFRENVQQSENYIENFIEKQSLDQYIQSIISKIQNSIQNYQNIEDLLMSGTDVQNELLNEEQQFKKTLNSINLDKNFIIGDLEGVMVQYLEQYLQEKDNSFFYAKIKDILKEQQIQYNQILYIHK